MSRVPQPRNHPTRRDARGRKPSDPLEASIMVLLHSDHGKLPAGYTYLLPVDAGRMLIHKRVATVALAVSADFVLPDEDWEAATT